MYLNYYEVLDNAKTCPTPSYLSVSFHEHELNIRLSTRAAMKSFGNMFECQY